MLILANLMGAVAQILSGLLWFAIILVFARVVLSWVNADPHNGIVRFIIGSTDPLLIPLQRKFPLRYGPLDFTPIVLLLLLSFLDAFLVQTIADYAFKIRRQELMGEVHLHNTDSTRAMAATWYTVR